jgi:hypothetical protein
VAKLAGSDEATAIRRVFYDIEEIMEVLKICVAEGVQACNLGVPILAEELANLLASK